MKWNCIWNRQPQPNVYSCVLYLSAKSINKVMRLIFPFYLCKSLWHNRISRQSFHSTNSWTKMNLHAAQSNHGHSWIEQTFVGFNSANCFNPLVLWDWIICLLSERKKFNYTLATGFVKSWIQVEIHPFGFLLQWSLQQI